MKTYSVPQHLLKFWKLPGPVVLSVCVLIGSTSTRFPVRSVNSQVPPPQTYGISPQEGEQGAIYGETLQGILGHSKVQDHGPHLATNIPTNSLQ